MLIYVSAHRHVFYRQFWDHENSDEWKVSNIAKVSRSRRRCHVGYFEHSQLFRTMVAQVRSHTANDSWKKLIFLPQIKKIKAREKARKETKMTCVFLPEFQVHVIHNSGSWSTILPSFPTSEGGTTSLDLATLRKVHSRDHAYHAVYEYSKHS